MPAKPAPTITSRCCMISSPSDGRGRRSTEPFAWDGKCAHARLADIVRRHRAAAPNGQGSATKV